MNDDNNSPRTVYINISTILYCLMLLLSAYLIGAVIIWLFPNLVINGAVNAAKFMYGAAAVLLIKLLLKAATVIIRSARNRHKKKLAAMMVMQTEHEFKNAGVRTPLDFCYLMLTTNYETPINIWSGLPDRLKQLKDLDLYSKDCLIFKEMFGRNPMKADSFDWLSVTIYEAFVQREKIESELTFQDIKTMVSPEVLKTPTRFTQEWDFEIQRQFSDRCKALATETELRRKQAGVK